MATIEITSVSSLLEAVKSTGFTSKAHTHVRVWFRGQADKNWSLSPGVYRSDFALDETERQKKERHLTQDFQALGAPFLNHTFSDSELYFIQQHYSMPTRLLDWSLNPLAGLFFALGNNNINKDGIFYAIDAYGYAGERGFCTPRSNEVRDAVASIFEWDNNKWPNDILYIRPFNVDPRITGQRGCFTFHPPGRDRIDPSKEHMRKFRIPADAKETLRSELDLLGFDEFTVYGGLDRLAERLKRAYPTS